MKKVVLFSLLGMAGLAIYGYFVATPQNLSGDLPKIEISPQTYGFGDAQYGQVLQKTFVVKNTGTATLEIKKIATSCSCTSATVSNDTIEPGQETELLVVYDTGAMSGPHGMGYQERIINIKSNDPVNPQAEATINATIN